MTLNDVITLSNAGFTSDQIAKFAALPTQQPTQVQQSTQVMQPTIMQQPAQVQQPTQVMQPAIMQQPAQVQPITPTQQPIPVSNDDPFDKILRSIGALDQSIKSNAILGVDQPKHETTQDIIASIINPPTKDDKKGDK